MNPISTQKELCLKYNTEYLACPYHLKVGVALNVRNSGLPINGVRYIPEGDTSGWYLWVGEYSDHPDFFVPLHVEHLNEWCPEVIKYLGLTPGWRFLMTKDGYEDIWEDNSLLNIL